MSIEPSSLPFQGNDRIFMLLVESINNLKQWKLFFCKCNLNKPFFLFVGARLTHQNLPVVIQLRIERCSLRFETTILTITLWRFLNSLTTTLLHNCGGQIEKLIPSHFSSFTDFTFNRRAPRIWAHWRFLLSGRHFQRWSRIADVRPRWRIIFGKAKICVVSRQYQIGNIFVFACCVGLRQNENPKFSDCFYAVVTRYFYTKVGVYASELIIPLTRKYIKLLHNVSNLWIEFSL